MKSTVSSSGFHVSGRVYLLTMKIDCDTCVMREIACTDCVMSVLLNITVKESEISDNQVQAISVLAENGLVPPLRYAQ